MTWHRASPSYQSIMCVWPTAAPFMSLTFPAGYWISKHTVVCIFPFEHHHKIIHLTPCTDDSTYQVKHGIVKFRGPKSVLYGGKTLDVLLSCLFFCIFIFVLPTGPYSCIMEPRFPAVNARICFLSLCLSSSDCLIPSSLLSSTV